MCLPVTAVVIVQFSDNDDDDDDDTAHRNKQHTKVYQLKNLVMTARWQPLALNRPTLTTSRPKQCAVQ